MRKLIKILLLVIMFLLFILFLFPYFLPLSETTADTKFPFKESHYINVNNVELHYREWKPDSVKGNIMLIHGFSGSTFSWRKNTDTLVKCGYRVVAVDLPPFGYSSRQKGINHSSSYNAALLWKLADTLGGKNWILVGHSMGASVAGAMAAMRPSNTSKLVLVDGAFGGTTKQKRASFSGWIISSGPIKRLAEFVANKKFFTYKKIKELLESAYSGPADSLDVVGYLAPFKIKKTASGIMEMGRAYEVESLSLNALTMPTIAIWGKNDKWIPLKSGEQFIKKKTDAELFVIDGAGHCPMETHSSEFNKTLIRFLNNNR